jgi:hypothetical protein
MTVQYPPPAFRRQHTLGFTVGTEAEVDVYRDCPFGPTFFFIVIQDQGTSLDVYERKWGYRMGGWLCMYGVPQRLNPRQYPVIYMAPHAGWNITTVVHFFLI